jgi:hypothetical protein
LGRVYERRFPTGIVATLPRAQTPTSAGPSGGGAGDGGPVVPLTWEELRMAAEAGFDELLRQQELQVRWGREMEAAEAVRGGGPFGKLR